MLIVDIAACIYRPVATMHRHSSRECGDAKQHIDNYTVTSEPSNNFSRRFSNTHRCNAV